MSRWVLLALLAALMLAVGDVYQAKALLAIGRLTSAPLDFRLLLHMLNQTGVLLVLVFRIGFFLAWLLAVKHLELSVAIPLTAFSSIVYAVLSGPALGEVASARDWLSSGVIGAGLILVVRSNECE